ncbi:MAG: hypothetical protein OXS35_00520 [Dehalococcoidia bacterium]|nr:hypothetical protein [Dehalococcoidia bacterium]
MLDCLQKGAKLVDVGFVWLDHRGTPWRRVRTVEGVDGWVGDGLVEGPEAAYTGPIPWVDFPDDVAVLVQALRATGKEGASLDLARIYKRDNEIIRETIFSYDAEVGGYYNYGLIAAPDASSHTWTSCIEPPCEAFSVGGYPPGRFALNESRDGGVTWEQLVEFDAPDVAEQILPGGDGDDRLVLRPWHSPGLMLWPSGEVLEEPEAPEGYDWRPPRDRVVLNDGRLAWAFDEPISSLRPSVRANLYLTAEGEDVTELVLGPTNSCPKCHMLPDGRGLVLGWDTAYYLDELMGGAAAGYYDDPRGYYGDGVPRPWLTIRDLETGEEWPIRLPPDVLTLDNLQFLPVAVQQGPFLRVADVGDVCLPIRADPSLGSEELTCVAERVLLTDLDDTSEVDDVTWRRVRIPAGVEGWVEERFLE